MSDVATRAIEAVTHGRYLVRIPDGPPPYRLIVGFHGYGENAERHLEQLAGIPGTANWLLISVQGLHRFYGPKMEDVVASWMTRQDREQAITDNVAYVDRVVGTVLREFACDAPVFAGFSQGVAMAFRAAALGAHWPRGVIALAGDIPPDVRDHQPLVLPPVLVGRGTGDGWYTDEKLQADTAWLRAAGVDVETHVFEGGHQWSGPFREAAGAFLDRIDSPRLKEKETNR